MLGYCGLCTEPGKDNGHMLGLNANRALSLRWHERLSWFQMYSKNVMVLTFLPSYYGLCKAWKGI
jgi:hypothetical protein